MGQRQGETAVIFASVRNGDDAAGYDAAAIAMERLAARQPGYRGIESARGADGAGITVSYWADDAAAAVPTPPVGSFAGDRVSIAVTTNAGEVTWTASAANASGVTTELVAQRLPSEVALPTLEL